ALTRRIAACLSEPRRRDGVVPVGEALGHLLACVGVAGPPGSEQVRRRCAHFSLDALVPMVAERLLCAQGRCDGPQRVADGSVLPPSEGRIRTEVMMRPWSHS